MQGALPGVTACNARWLASPHTDQARLTRNVLMDQLRHGRPLLLQETHWDAEGAAGWTAIIPATAVHTTPAAAGTRPPAGSAILLPTGRQLRDAWT